jgi:hypothetical protein
MFGKKIPATAICIKYLEIKFTGIGVDSSISFVIIAINLVLKAIVIALLTMVRDPTNSR